MDRGLQRIYGGFHSRKAAFGAVNRAEDRMDVRVDQPRQDKLPLEVDHRGGGPNQRRDLSASVPTETMVLPLKAIACWIERA